MEVAGQNWEPACVVHQLFDTLSIVGEKRKGLEKLHCCTIKKQTVCATTRCALKVLYHVYWPF